jgi:hypothetical protein
LTLDGPVRLPPQTVSFTVPDSLARTEDAANFAPEAAGVQTGRTGRP